MYIRLGKSQISYEPSNVDDFMTITQVVSASMSFERPAIVSMKTQLTALFGESFPEKAFLEELIDWGAVLYLYRPISTKDDHNQEGYIDLEKCNTPEPTIGRMKGLLYFLLCLLINGINNLHALSPLINTIRSQILIFFLICLKILIGL